VVPAGYRYSDLMPILLCRLRLAHRTQVQCALPSTANAIVFLKQAAL